MDATEPNDSTNHIQLREKVYDGRPRSDAPIRIPDLSMVYAETKYQSRAAHGPRVPDAAGPALDDLAEALLNILEATWRQGWRNEQLVRVATTKLKERRKRA